MAFKDLFRKDPSERQQALSQARVSMMTKSLYEEAMKNANIQGTPEEFSFEQFESSQDPNFKAIQARVAEKGIEDRDYFTWYGDYIKQQLGKFLGGSKVTPGPGTPQQTEIDKQQQQQNQIDSQRFTGKTMMGQQEAGTPMLTSLLQALTQAGGTGLSLGRIMQILPTLQTQQQQRTAFEFQPPPQMAASTGVKQPNILESDQEDLFKKANQTNPYTLANLGSALSSMI